MIELDLAFVIEKVLKDLAVIKQTAAWQFEAERILTKKLQSLFSDTFKKTISELKRVGVPSNDIQKKMIASEIQSLEDKYKTVMGETAIEASNVSRGKVQQMLDFPITDFSKQYSDLIADHTFIASQGTLDRMVGEVMDNLTQSYEDGLGIDEAAESLRSVFDGMMDYELARVARTEIQSLQNEGAHVTIQDLGVSYEQWWTAEDSRVRGNDPDDTADHVILHGQIVRTGDPFENGLMYPGDRSGPIEEWINCRCRVVPFLMPEGFMAPPGKSSFYEEDLVEIAA